jgi:hypothetical protein
MLMRYVCNHSDVPVFCGIEAGGHTGAGLMAGSGYLVPPLDRPEADWEAVDEDVLSASPAMPGGMEGDSSGSLLD